MEGVTKKLLFSVLAVVVDAAVEDYRLSEFTRWDFSGAHPAN
jgi:hypothetical protein